MICFFMGKSKKTRKVLVFYDSYVKVVSLYFKVLDKLRYVIIILQDKHVMKTKKIKLHYTMKAQQSQLHSEYEGFALKEIDQGSVTFIYTQDEIKTWVCVDNNTIALMRLEDGMTAVWLNEFNEGLVYKSTPLGAFTLPIKGEAIEISDDVVSLTYHIMEGDTTMETITQTWEVL